MTLRRVDLRHPDGRAFHVYDRVGTWDLAGEPAATGLDPTHLHRRFDRLTGTWVLVSPARNTRPSATTSGDDRPACPLCPGGGELPGPFALAVFDNRFPSLAVRCAGGRRRRAAWPRPQAAARSSCTAPSTSSTRPTSRPPSSPP